MIFEKHWNTYKKGLPPGLKPEGEKQLKFIFYAGAFCLFKEFIIIGQSPSNPTQFAEDRGTLNAFHEELVKELGL